ncbi:MAG: hypothetical protein ACLTBB_07805 [Roseburia hominis]
MDRDLNSSPHWVLSGSVTGWYDELVSVFDLIVFVYVPTDIRMERLRRREAERYGDAILPGTAGTRRPLNSLNGHPPTIQEQGQAEAAAKQHIDVHLTVGRSFRK